MENQRKQFGWKRKIGANVSKTAVSAFESDAKEEDGSGEVDWLSLVPLKKKNIIGLEDSIAKSSRLVQEGAVLASSDRYWEALKKWDEALLYSPCDCKIHEMKAQALMELCEVYPAVQAAKKAVECDPTWWIGHQTLGRAHLGLGEVRLALKSFSRAVHLNPSDKELWEEDLMWAYSLLQKKQRLDEEKKQETEKQASQSSVKITELDENDTDECDNSESVCDSSLEIYKGSASESGQTPSDSNHHLNNIKRLPRNYIQMRDPT